MLNRPRVALVGNSLYMDGVAVSLANSEMFGLEEIEMDRGDLQEYLQSIRPELIVVELNHPLVEAIRCLLRAKPEQLIIGLDIENCHAIVMNCRRQVTESMADLCKLVQNELHPAVRHEIGECT